MPILATIPLLLPFVLLAVFRWNGMRTSLTTVAVTLALAAVFRPSPIELGTIALTSVERALAIVVGVLTVLFPGLWLYRLQVATGGLTRCVDVLQRSFAVPEIRILTLVIAVSPFVEAISGFGVCILVIAPLLLALGLAPARAGFLVLLSQISIPLGALGVGTMIAARLAGLPVDRVGEESLLLTAPLPMIFALVALTVLGGRTALRRYWWAAVLAGGAKGTLDPLLTDRMGVEVAGALSSALVVAVMSGIDRGMRRDAWRRQPPLDRATLAALLPYLVLVTSLVVTRTVPGIREWLQGVWVVEPFAAGFRYPLIYIPGFWMLSAVATTIAVARPDPGVVARSVVATWHQFLPAATTMIAFLFVAQVMILAGMAAAVASTAAALGTGYVLAAPVLGAIGGWLTGSNSGGNAMFVPLQTEMAHHLGLSHPWVIAAQNAAASYGTVGSPARITLVGVTLGHRDLESELMRRTAPLVLLSTVVIAGLLTLSTALSP